MTRRLVGSISLIWLMVAAATASAAGAPALTTIQTPRADQVVGARGHLAVVVRSRAPLRAMRSPLQ
jgi:hypothetical protein